ncbi:hypothetical protein GOBAR_AA30325 [Gossypium barbadense]|uniref:Uncharacterized protein n=1 Tax=Gossypium barbadense TaxID=3634 RepID=A0A2P5WGZ2_GOSBA|nr:hypothetical protein GOBAR_AA30325 [Gossypium barbadense]
MGDETIIQPRNSSNTSKIEGDCINHTTSTDDLVKPSVQKTSLKSAHEPCSSNNKGPLYEERRLRVRELVEWRTHKPKPCLDEFNIPPNQLKVGYKVLLDVANPCTSISKSNGEIPLTVLNIFPYGTVEVIHPKFGTIKDAISCHSRATWPWTSLSKQHGHATRLCLETVVETENLARACQD